MDTGDFLIAVAFGVFLLALISSQRRQAVITRRSDRRAIADAIARTSAEPAPITVDRPSRRGKR
jgi:hypothetical protein